jgi:hypothetical protein
MSAWNPVAEHNGPFAEAIRDVFGRKEVLIGSRFKITERKLPDGSMALVVYAKQRDGGWRAEAALDDAGLHVRGNVEDGIDFSASEWRL